MHGLSERSELDVPGESFVDLPVILSRPRC